MITLQALTPEEDAARLSAAARLGAQQALTEAGCVLQPLLDVRAVNLILGLAESNRSTVYDLARTGELRALRIGGQLRFRSRDVDAYLDARADDHEKARAA